MKAQWSVLGLVLFFCFGLYISVFSPKIFTEFSGRDIGANTATISRDPAAIKRTYDFSGLDGSALAKAQKQRLLAGAKVVREKTGEVSAVGVELGHFVLKGEDGQKAFACQKYEKIQLTFVGEGTAVNGELPKMEVEGLCEMSADINSISPIWIPVAKILGEPVGDGEFSFHEGKTVLLRFANVTDQWPTTWQLQSLTLSSNEKVGETVVIPQAELRQFLPKPMLLDWK